jgi:MFS family permease
VDAAPADPADADGGRRPGWRWAVLAGLAGVAASTLATALAAAVAGRQSDLALDPVELALRIGLLLGAPCIGAVLAAVVVPVPSGRAAPSGGQHASPRTPPNRAVPLGGRRLAVAAVGLGVPIGPLLVLRLDRVREFGPTASLLAVGVMVTWGVVGAALAAGWWARPGRRVQRTDLPLPPLPPQHVEAGGDPRPPGPAT